MTEGTLGEDKFGSKSKSSIGNVNIEVTFKSAAGEAGC